MKNDYNITYYQLLGVESDASREEIEKAWKSRVKEVHPDTNGNHKSAQELFSYVQQAKQVLLNDLKRLEYDYLIGVKKRPAKRVIQNNRPKQNSSGIGSLVATFGFGLLIGLLFSSKDK